MQMCVGNQQKLQSQLCSALPSVFFSMVWGEGRETKSHDAAQVGL